MAVIPARAGSRRLAGKNLAVVANRPMVAWTLDGALAATSVDRVVVSTDDPQVSRLAQSMGISVPELRPPHLSGDGVPPQDVLAYELERHSPPQPETLLLLQPTSPLRQARDIDAALALMERTGADAVVSACRWNRGRWGVEVDEDGILMESGPILLAGHGRSGSPPDRSASSTTPGRLNGAIFAARTTFFRDTGTFYGRRTVVYWMPPERSVDVDTARDLAYARRLLRGTDDSGRPAGAP